MAPSSVMRSMLISVFSLTPKLHFIMMDEIESTMTHHKNRRGSLISLISSDSPTSDPADTSSHSDDYDSSDNLTDLDEQYKLKLREILEVEDEMEKHITIMNCLTNERAKQISEKIADIQSGSDLEFRTLKAQLEIEFAEKIEVAERRAELRLNSIEEQFTALVGSTHLQLQEEKARAKAELTLDTYEKLNIAIENLFSKQFLDIRFREQIYACLKRGSISDEAVSSLEPRGRKRPLTVSSPFIVYNLQEHEINEDLAEIKEACGTPQLLIKDAMEEGDDVDHQLYDSDVDSDYFS